MSDRRASRPSRFTLLAAMVSLLVALLLEPAFVAAGLTRDRALLVGGAVCSVVAALFLRRDPAWAVVLAAQILAWAVVFATASPVLFDCDARGVCQASLEWDVDPSLVFVSIAAVAAACGIELGRSRRVRGVARRLTR
jgi:hypothetical protein